MNDFLTIIVASWLAGLAGFGGGVVAWCTGVTGSTKEGSLAHGVIAFGGGILIAAVVFALLPSAMKTLGPLALGFAFCAGGLLFSIVDIRLGRRGGSKAQFMAMLLDFLPEALALGAVFGRDHRLGVLLAVFIGAQNLPEGFNAYQELTGRRGMRTGVALTSLLLVSLLGPIAAWAGYAFLQEAERVTSIIMTFSGGGIMYLIFQDIAPQAKIGKRWMPALGAVLGFAVGMIGKQLLD